MTLPIDLTSSEYVVGGPADNIPVDAPTGRTLLSGQADPRRQEPRPTLRQQDTLAGKSDRFRVRPRFSLRAYAGRRPRRQHKRTSGSLSGTSAAQTLQTPRHRAVAIGMVGAAAHGRRKALVPRPSTASRTHCVFRAKHSPPRPLPDAHRVEFDRWCRALPLIIDPFGRGPGENEGLNWPHCDGVGASEPVALACRQALALVSSSLARWPTTHAARGCRIGSSHAAECFVARAVLAAASGLRRRRVGLARAADCLRHRSRSVSLGWFRAA